MDVSQNSFPLTYFWSEHKTKKKKFCCACTLFSWLFLFRFWCNNVITVFFLNEGKHWDTEGKFQVFWKCETIWKSYMSIQWHKVNYHGYIIDENRIFSCTAAVSLPLSTECWIRPYKPSSICLKVSSFFSTVCKREKQIKVLKSMLIILHHQLNKVFWAINGHCEFVSEGNIWLSFPIKSH